MKKLTAGEIVAKYTESSKIMEVAITSDPKTNNREARKNHKLFLLLKEDMELAKEVYGELLNSNHIIVRGHASADCLRLKIFVPKAVETLEEIANTENIGIMGFGATMCLRIWRGEVPGETL